MDPQARWHFWVWDPKTSELHREYLDCCGNMYTTDPEQAYIQAGKLIAEADRVLFAGQRSSCSPRLVLKETFVMQDSGQEGKVMVEQSMEKSLLELAKRFPAPFQYTFQYRTSHSEMSTFSGAVYLYSPDSTGVQEAARYRYGMETQVVPQSIKRHAIGASGPIVESPKEASTSTASVARQGWSYLILDPSTGVFHTVTWTTDQPLDNVDAAYAVISEMHPAHTVLKDTLIAHPHWAAWGDPAVRERLANLKANKEMMYRMGGGPITGQQLYELKSDLKFWEGTQKPNSVTGCYDAMKSIQRGHGTQVAIAFVKQDLLEAAWGVIANVGNGNWSNESVEWRSAAARWREDYHKTLKSVLPSLCPDYVREIGNKAREDAVSSVVLTATPTPPIKRKIASVLDTPQNT